MSCSGLIGHENARNGRSWSKESFWILSKESTGQLSKDILCGKKYFTDMHISSRITFLISLLS